MKAQTQTPSSRPFDPIVTAKPVCAIKEVATQPAYWQNIQPSDNRGPGKRQTPLVKTRPYHLFLTEEDINQVKQRPDYDKIGSTAVRERAINKLYQNCIKQQGIRQVVLLGARYDIRALKKGKTYQENKKHAAIYGKTTFWEIDKAEILTQKQQLLANHNVDPNANYISCDYLQGNFVAKLLEAGVDPQSETLFIWEGNLMYLTSKQQLDSIFKALKEGFAKFTLVFDYFEQTFLDELKSDFWRQGIANIKLFAAEHQLKLKFDKDIASLAIEYEVDSKPSSEKSRYHVCALGI